MIYNKFINLQKNEKIDNLQNIKNITLDKINVQQINERDLITLSLLNKDITEFIYNSEIFENKTDDFNTTFRRQYTYKNLQSADGVFAYKFCE